jgi:NAD+ synthase
VSRILDRLRLNGPLAVEVLTRFIKDAVEMSGTSGVVVGLSGGIDSSLAAALAVRALGPERVHGFLLPYRTSSAESETDARLVAGHLSRRGNKMARERMTILFDQAKKLGALVLGTSNKTEILLGYSTVFGDNASSLNPLGDLYKHQVWQLARHLELPEQVVAKRPSADLFPGQTDEDDLGFDYATADEVLWLLFDEGLAPEEVVERGYDEAVVSRIVRFERQFRFKRRLMLIARLSGSAVNLDQEIPRD